MRTGAAGRMAMDPLPMMRVSCRRRRANSLLPALSVAARAAMVEESDSLRGVTDVRGARQPMLRFVGAASMQPLPRRMHHGGRIAQWLQMIVEELHAHPHELHQLGVRLFVGLWIVGGINVHMRDLG